MYDVIIVGAGPAGLSAATILGRCRRRVLVLETGRYRNAASHALHGFLSRDGIEPSELLRVAREQLRVYDSVELRRGEVVDAACLSGASNRHAPPRTSFEVTQGDGTRLVSRKLLLATGVVDQLPDIEGLADLYGRSVFHCPYCDGWEVRDQPIAIYGRGKSGTALSLELTAWSRDLVLCTGGGRVTAPSRERLTGNGIRIRTDRIERLEGRDGILERVVFAGGSVLDRRALFFTTGQLQRSPLPSALGCRFNKKGTVSTGRNETTNVAGLYVAGDASRAVQLAIVAAAEGARAAFAINSALLEEDLQ